MNIVKEFEKVRGVPYRIPLSTTRRDDCCSGKAERLLDTLKTEGYEARYRVCVFKWSDLSMPSKLLKIPHDDECTHTYLEIKLNGKWKVLDATWDSGLADILAVNDWDGKSNTGIAVPVRKLFSPKHSAKYMRELATTDAIQKDLKRNRRFYKAFNGWLETERIRWAKAHPRRPRMRK